MHDMDAVHPRIRGEHVQWPIGSMAYCGSSPHTRGTLCILTIRYTLLRFIPAYAGNTMSLSFFATWHTVHPRIRGEHDLLVQYPLFDLGSSPHTRGTHFRREFLKLRFRFIPAYAGNTVQRMRNQLVTAVHPRIRGEHRPSKAPDFYSVGSSPHTRGTPATSSSSGTNTRFIPAYAGNTPLDGWTEVPEPVHPRIRGEHIANTALKKAAAGSSPHTRGTRT